MYVLIKIYVTVFLCEIENGGLPKVVSEDEMDSLLRLTTEEIINYHNSPKWLWASLKKADELAKKILQKNHKITIYFCTTCQNAPHSPSFHL